MSDLKTVPLTVVATERDIITPQVVIGKEWLPDPGKPKYSTGGYWVTVLDRSTLKPVWSKLWETPDKAPDIGNYDTTDYMLVVSTIHLGTGLVPQGAFYDFLMDNGAGRELKRIVQLNQTLGCGSWGSVAYAMTGVLGPGKPMTQGVELSQIDASSGAIIMTASLVPAQIGNKVIYTPMPLSD